MNKAEIREEAQLYFVPFFLGSNSTSHKLSKKIYRKYKITSYITDTKKTTSDFLDFTNIFWLLHHTMEDSIVVTQLIYLAEQTPYTLPLLIPCTPKYTELVERNRQLLESYFVILNHQDLLSNSPLNIIP